MAEQAPASFWDFIAKARFRYYQERDLGLDLYHAGWPGVFLLALAVASAVIFLLAIFHVIPARRHVVLLLLAAGTAAAGTGLATSYHHYRNLPRVESRIIRPAAGPRPANDAEKAAVIALPLALGAANLAASVLGCLYMAVFWSAASLGRQPPAANRRPST